MKTISNTTTEMKTYNFTNEQLNEMVKQIVIRMDDMEAEDDCDGWVKDSYDDYGGLEIEIGEEYVNIKFDVFGYVEWSDDEYSSDGRYCEFTKKYVEIHNDETSYYDEDGEEYFLSEEQVKFIEEKCNSRY